MKRIILAALVGVLVSGCASEPIFFSPVLPNQIPKTNDPPPAFAIEHIEVKCLSGFLEVGHLSDADFNKVKKMCGCVSDYIAKMTSRELHEFLFEASPKSVTGADLSPLQKVAIAKMKKNQQDCRASSGMK
jgi:hypothetical protein